MIMLEKTGRPKCALGQLRAEEAKDGVFLEPCRYKKR